MSTPAAFSRLQLAAALLEYDNDPDNPDAPYRSAQDSAIFAHLRRNPAARPDIAPRRSDYLIPSDTGSLGGRESAQDTRRSRASSGLRNPFGADNYSEFEEHDEGEGEDRLEVDLASWGLDAFMPKDKSKSAKAKGKQPAPAVGSTRSRHPSTNHDPPAILPRRGLVTTKSASVGGHLEDLDIDVQVDRRRSFGSPLELAGMEPSNLPLQRRRAASQTSMTQLNSGMVPFPSTSARSPSPGTEGAYGERRSVAHDRTYSLASMNSRLILEESRDEMEIRQRNVSNDTLGTTLGISKPPENNPFAIQNPSHISRFDPKTISRARSASNASMGSRILLENDDSSVVTGNPYARERRYSTLELLRPKVLVMPSPLQPVSPHVYVEPTRNVRGGFELSADGPPLPPGARSTRRLSSTVSVLEKVGDIPVASNSFTPNPLMDLTLSQKTFRNTLVVPGQPAPYDMGISLPRATEDGEQAELDPSGNEDPPEMSPPPEAHVKGSRPAGKLYGKSLIDDLESRKAQMRSKQRVFTGDQRPSMMARDQQRSSTLIDPASLQTRPTTQRMSSHGSQGLSRHPSLTMKPLLNFDGDEDKLPQRPPAANRLPSARSVFGVDTLWEREMAKLKEIQAIEERENEERRKREEEEELRKQRKKDKRKKKSKRKEEPEVEQIEQVLDSRVSAEPPTLPDIQRAPRRAPPKPSDTDISSESDGEDAHIPAIQREPSWHVGSSDEEDAGPRRTTGTGPRFTKVKNANNFRPTNGDSSEEDLPLAATIYKAQVRATVNGRGYPQDSDDEDRPLSHVLQRGKTSSIQSKFNKLSFDQSDDEDNQPLGLRASRITSNPVHAEAEDDVPLAFHPEQQRRTQYQMLAQQQQQQMMMHAQMQSNMLMNASLMGSPYYPPPMMNPMAMMQMQVPMPIPSPPPVQDEAKFGLVDRWRRDVVVEGEHL
ncbi:hypothetical protein GALMADRAFT_236114 [Galerina marginata CBS 339.88]|uniref:Uncharacterized protein n=1 Tax=Galerina marginata (strain CBS 339.88) TaxID=685588 RepID=A0A067TN47_GALM3|nr:hypothetical protein GALMADRAFT_236114 [Galerina marginata CBS 339.88]